MAKPAVDIAAEVLQLESLPLDRLREHWRRLHQTPPPKRLSRDILLRGLAYKMQETAFGGLSKAILRKLQTSAPSEASPVKKRRPRPSFKSGTRLVREWHGVTHTVVILADGVEWRGQRYRSLSVVAREITGAHWSGPQFFGINGARKAGRGHDARAGQRARRPRARQIRSLLASQNAVGSALAPLVRDAGELHHALERAAELSRNWVRMAPQEMHALLRSFVSRVALLAGRIDITIGVGRLAHALGASTASGHNAGPTIDLSVAAELRRSGRGKPMVIGNPRQAASDASLVDVLKEAFAAREKLLADNDETLNEITERTTKSKGRLTALMRLSYLAPEIIADIMAGGSRRNSASSGCCARLRTCRSTGRGSAPSWG